MRPITKGTSKEKRTNPSGKIHQIARRPGCLPRRADIPCQTLSDGTSQSLPAVSGAFGGSLEARHYRPYFDLWTIWGAFAPVGYDEGRAIVDWRPHGNVTVSAHGAFRRYGETDAGFELRTNGWRAGADATWTPSDQLLASASYDIDVGSGAANTDGRVGMSWLRSDGTMLGADASVTQNIYEFRVGTGRIYGAMLRAAFPLRPDARVALDVGLYQHVKTNGAVGPDWTQRRASARFEWTVGRDPGVRAGATRP